MRPIWPVISSVALAVWPASSLTSAATTAKPRPASPARAASMVALSASRLVWLAIDEIRPTTSPMRDTASLSSRMCPAVPAASSTALRASAAEPETWRPISWTEAPSSSAAAATVPTFSAVWPATAATEVERAAASVAPSVMIAAVAWSSVAEAATLADDAADGALEGIGHLAHAGAALRLGRGAGERRLLLQGPGADQVVAKHLHGGRHGADLVAASAGRHRHGGVAVGEGLHRGGHPPDRQGDAEMRHRAAQGDEQERRPEQGRVQDQAALRRLGGCIRRGHAGGQGLVGHRHDGVELRGDDFCHSGRVMAGSAPGEKARRLRWIAAVTSGVK